MSPARQRLLIAVGLAAAFTGLCTLLGSRERPWADARIMYEVAEQFGHGEGIAVRTLFPPLSQHGADGRVYSQYALGPSLVSLPGVLLRRGLDEVWPRARGFTLILTSHLAMSLLGGLLCGLFFALSVRLGATPWSAALGTIALGTGTIVWVYARATYSEALQAVCALGLISELIRVTHLGETARARGLALGAWAGALLNAKAVFALSIAGAGVWLVIALRRRRAELRRVVAWSAASALPLLGLALLYNQLRWGGALRTGYDDTLDLMRENPLAGLWGMLFSFGKSVFVYSPPLVLAAAVSWPFWRERPRVALSIGVVCLPVLGFYARFLAWSGDYCWGPRYLVYLVAPMLLSVPWWLDRVAGRRWLRRTVFGGFFALGAFVQLLGGSFYWGHSVRISMAASREWLGRPNRAGSAPAERGRGMCDSCFEDTHGLIWLPSLNPVLEHWWLIKHVPFRDSWETARGDAPWRNHTSLHLDAVKPQYDGVNLDYWIIDFRLRERPVAVLFMVWGGGLLLGGIYLTRRGLRAGRPA